MTSPVPYKSTFEAKETCTICLSKNSEKDTFNELESNTSSSGDGSLSIAKDGVWEDLS